MEKRRIKKLKIVEKKLGREKAWGFCYWDKPKIEIDVRAKGKKRLGYLVHELIHKAFGPELAEYKVIIAERIIRDGLWQDNYRQVDQ